MNQNLITVDPNISMGKPVIKGTRISVDFILDLYAGGLSTEQILKRYPHISRESLQAALSYAADSLRDLRIYLLRGLPSVPPKISGELPSKPPSFLNENSHR